MRYSGEILIKYGQIVMKTFFTPSARWARRGIVVPFVRRRLPRAGTFLPKVKAKGQGQRFKKKLLA